VVSTNQTRQRKSNRPNSKPERKKRILQALAKNQKRYCLKLAFFQKSKNYIFKTIKSTSKKKSQKQKG